MDDIEPDEDRMEARRRQKRLEADLDRIMAEKPEPVTPEPPAPAMPPMHPAFARCIGRYSPAWQDEWINRMARKYGGEW
jgi:hypothetical protein